VSAANVPSSASCAAPKLAYGADGPDGQELLLVRNGAEMAAFRLALAGS